MKDISAIIFLKNNKKKGKEENKKKSNGGLLLRRKKNKDTRWSSGLGCNICWLLAARIRWWAINRTAIGILSPLNSLSPSATLFSFCRISDAVGLDTRLTSCVAHDGSHESQQELLDSDGCSLDTSILPNVQERIINRSGSVIKLLYANFQAFRFPDRDHLHLKCTVVVCKGKCLMVWSSFTTHILLLYI